MPENLPKHLPTQLPQTTPQTPAKKLPNCSQIAPEIAPEIPSVIARENYLIVGTEIATEKAKDNCLRNQRKYCLKYQNAL